ncbi:solute carrier family 23 protein [Streptomyces sp. NPDC056491]|uniref:solute carrier family 23 protein n=1 Tax=Streptomyces sp. NPDC056491 TaxID=3345837 RepID=UPI003695A75D
MAFTENIGLVRMSKVMSRHVVVATGVFMVVRGLPPKAGSLVTCSSTGPMPMRYASRSTVSRRAGGPAGAR